MKRDPRRMALTVLLSACALLLAACAPGADTVAASTAPAGFWLGLWHGFICPITFLISLFNDHVGVYEVRNNGHWYDFGFVLGILVAANVFHGPRYVQRRRTGSKG